MTSTDLADLVAAHYNAIPEDERPVQFQAIRPKKKADVVAERGSWGVYVMPSSEEETPIDNGDACDERVRVRTIINGPCKDLKDGLKFCKFIRRSLRETSFLDPDPEEEGAEIPYDWQGNELTVSYDEEAIQKGQFLANFESEYYGIA